MARTYVALDTETTGLDPEQDAIIEIGAIKFRDEQELGSWSTLVNPHRPVPYKIQHLTGIMREELARAPTLSQVAHILTDFVGDCPIIGHNVLFDLKFLNKQGLFLNHPVLDTFELASILLPQEPRYSLSLLAESLDIEQSRQHRALDDARATKSLFLSLRQAALELDWQIVQEINRVAAGTNWALRDFFADVQRQLAYDKFISAPARPRYRYEAKAEKVADQALEPVAEKQPIDGEALAEMLSPGGLFAQRFPGYEHRPQQIEMLRAVTEAFNLGYHLLVEAGTGTGKSVAYLLPAIYFAHQNGRHVVISTNTINLQDQLLHKDIPDLRKIVPFDFKAVLLKGRSNYLCRRRLAAFQRSANLGEEEARVLAKILVWLPQTTTGDRAELTLLNTELKIWTQVQAEAETCLADRCPYREQGRCFLYRARHEAESAHLIIVNHALFLSDIMTDNRVLPEYRHLIIDEAHHLEEQATEQLGFSVGQVQLHRLLNDLSRLQSPGRFAGLLTDIAIRTRRANLPEHIQSQVEAHIDTLHEQVDQARGALSELFNELAILLDNFQPQPGRGAASYDLQVRLTSALRIQPAWSNVELLWDSLAKPWRRIARGIEELYGSLQQLENAQIEGFEELLLDITSILIRLREMDAHLEAIISDPSPKGIYWAQVSAQTGTITLHMAPLHVSPLLEKLLFQRVETVILTSATLCSEGDFSYIRERLGLWEADELQVGSPFDYESSTLLYLPMDMPEPGEIFYQRAVERTLIEMCRATKGRTLALFTSHSQLLNTYRVISPVLERDGIIVYGQGLDGSRRQLLDSFRNTPQAVLLGTRSFWEGVDVVGPALSCLVIVRLPFAVPSDPIFAARAETFDEPFSQYSIPDAILRFRQGFGRLIRSTTDRGVVVVLDKRILTKFYGSSFLRSLPECTVQKGSLKDLPAAAARWLDGDKA